MSLQNLLWIHYCRSPTPSLHSSTCVVADTCGNPLFQHPAMRYTSGQPMTQQPYNPTSANEPTYIHIQTTPQPAAQPSAQPAAPKQAPGYKIDYGYSNPNLNSRFKFFEDSSPNNVSNGRYYRNPRVRNC